MSADASTGACVPETGQWSVGELAVGARVTLTLGANTNGPVRRHRLHPRPRRARAGPPRLLRSPFLRSQAREAAAWPAVRHGRPSAPYGPAPAGPNRDL
ncbi:hypothetical protein ACIQ62_34200 [Streptomyces sp. NPDC096319]|uniref:hypothetical protein n=1 Tax=Streptomyces sp. NPDC096319 TaxID=3366084 RepID=UPI00382BB605